MNDSCTSHTAPNKVWFLGPVPPPVTGITVMTKEVLLGLQAAGPVRFASWSPGMARRGLQMRLLRNLRIVQSLFKLVSHGRAKGSRLYVSANSSGGLWLTMLAVAAAQHLGYQIYLHHHSYAYIDAYDWRIAWMDRRMAGGVHVVHCEHMARDFTARYRTKRDFQFICPSIVLREIGEPRPAANTPLRLGLLSNLTMEKGLGETLQVFAALLERNRNVTLTLAGPLASRESRPLVENALTKHPDRLHVIGPAYGDDKRKFFAEIDVFLFPTKTESWGLVLNESLAAGVPVITVDRGCIPVVVGPDAGLVIDPRAPFVEIAARQVEHWIDDRQAYRLASQAAILQAGRLREDGRRTLNDFVRHMFSPLTAASANA